MSLATVLTKSPINGHALTVEAEVSISNGLPMLNIVGLPEKSVKESKDRVRAAIINSKLPFPNKRITVNLTPADVPKYGAHYDLAIALGILIASNTIEYNPKRLQNTFFFGELSLNGSVRTPKGLLSCLINCSTNQQQAVFSSHQTIYQQLVDKKTACINNHLLQAITYLKDDHWVCQFKQFPIEQKTPNSTLDITDVNQQFLAKQALTIAAAGGHHMLMFGPPGVGKSMLAERLTTLLPPLTHIQATELMCVYDQSQSHRSVENFFTPPFRTPHHTTSPIALVGGGTPIQPGEISLAHHGVLFLDELGEFHKNTLEALREPIEKGYIHIKRAQEDKQFLCQFQLIAAMNPPETRRLHQKISNALLDRIDISIELTRLDKKDILLNQTPPNNEPNSQALREQVKIAQARQKKRAVTLNGRITYTQLLQHLELEPAAKQIIQQAVEHFDLSVRSVHKIIRLAATIMDLAQENKITQSHIAQAIKLRNQMT